MAIVLKIDGMTCGHCTASVEKALLGVPGVSAAKADLAAKTATVTAADTVDRKALAAAVDDIGFDVLGVE
jgi:copper chaperone CopZ